MDADRATSLLNAPTPFDWPASHAAAVQFLKAFGGGWTEHELFSGLGSVSHFQRPPVSRHFLDIHHKLQVSPFAGGALQFKYSVNCFKPFPYVHQSVAG